MTWTKIDAALHLNPKIRMAGADAREIFLYILLANGAQSGDGVLNGHYAEPAFLADALQRSEESVRNGLKRCVTFHLLLVSDDEVSIVGWDNQWRTASSTPRVKKHREKVRREREEERKQILANGGTLRNVTETLQVVSETSETAKRERETDKKKERGARKRAARIPADWKPTEAHVTLAADENLDVLSEADKFRDHAESKGRTLVSWDAGFRNWLRQSAQYRTERNPDESYYPKLKRL